MNIVIVGGGTAGWLAGLILSKSHPTKKITVIESSTIGIIGAGEGSTGIFSSVLKNLIWNFDCDMMDFFKETGASLKYGIKHIDWREKGHSYYAPIGGSPAQSNNLDYVFAHYHHKNPEESWRSSNLGWATEQGLSNLNLKTFKFDKFESALHFDAHAVGRYLKKVTLKSPNANHLDDEVIDVKQDEQGNIMSLTLKSGSIVEGDFFIDASGFARVLTKKLEVKWISYQKNLPVNSAMPFLLDYKDNEIPDLWTTAWAQSSGWMWQIPTMKRRGCGYVFCDEFITPEKAQEEIETTLGRSIQPIRILKFDTGRLERAWTKNCLAVGLTAAFAEPLEATSIHTTICQLLEFSFEFLKDTKEETYNPASISCYNRRTAELYDKTKEFLVAHYMGGRQDSEFWRYISSGATKTEFVDDIIESCRTRYPSNRDLNPSFGQPDVGLWLYVLAGLGKLDPKISKRAVDVDLKYLVGPTADIHQVLDWYHQQIAEMHTDCMKFKDFVNFMRRHIE